MEVSVLVRSSVTSRVGDNSDCEFLTITLSVCVILFVFFYLMPNMNVAICCIFIFTGSNAYKNTPLILAGMAIECFVAVCYPLHHTRICTIRNTKILIGIIWLVGAVPAVVDLLVVLALRPLSFFTTSWTCYHQNVFDLEYNIKSHAVFNIGYMCLVWVLLFYTYFKVLFSTKAAASEPAQAQKARRTILLHLLIQLLLCTLSLFTTVQDGALTSLFPYFQSVIYFCTFLLTSILPRLLSPLIYGMRDQKFKKYMKSSLMCGSDKRAIKPSD
ncbi:LOW QUALITY PROTEIN: odorant receptor 135-1 [Onychostoma macrolepis]|uniref:LOW QUALITY PROTEIN: odorant receptor 135-1 n=1 Tax=Onychostoma macrolepis TaxID=369639 RepID=UPI00272AB725|nr:LOW QUALITY PROTEIN: odorant receptor 135-1 [Onychostoma macrolepis]